MGAADGTILGLETIHDTGHPSQRWDLVIVSDGYQQHRMNRFAEDARSAADALFQTAPFDNPDIQNAINIHRLDVVSADAGADKPNCADGGGTGTYARTYFDSTFCFDGRTQRLLYGNETLVHDTVEIALPEYNQILVLVDDRERGGGGASIGWFSNGGHDWRDVAIHELGHAAFKLADEYDYGNDDQWPGGEPAEVNVSAVSDPALVKWHLLVDAGATDPTRANPDCTHTDPGPSPVSAGTIGTFEGAKYSHCRIYRPAWDCMMRSTGKPFCKVCEHQIIYTLAPFLMP